MIFSPHRSRDHHLCDLADLLAILLPGNVIDQIYQTLVALCNDFPRDLIWQVSRRGAWAFRILKSECHRESTKLYDFECLLKV